MNTIDKISIRTQYLNKLGFCTEFVPAKDKTDSNLKIYIDTHGKRITTKIINAVQCAAKHQDCKVKLSGKGDIITYTIFGTHTQNYNMLGAILDAHNIDCFDL